MTKESKRTMKLLFKSTVIVCAINILPTGLQFYLHRVSKDAIASDASQHGNLIKISEKKTWNRETETFCYDADTKIIWLNLSSPNGCALSPYYVMAENGETEMAVLDKNYFIE